jgi:hypothetical protein
MRATCIDRRSEGLGLDKMLLRLDAAELPFVTLVLRRAHPARRDLDAYAMLVVLGGRSSAG